MGRDRPLVVERRPGRTSVIVGDDPGDESDHKCDMEWVGQRGPEVLIWKCKTCGREIS